MISYNIYLEEHGKNNYKLIMSSPPKGAKTGIALKWPVNPEFTGEHGIIATLQNLEQFKNFNFINY
jgi:hypothetical protein